MKPLLAILALGVSCVPAAAEPQPGEIRERLNTPVVESFQSRSAVYDLEVCVADAVSVYGTPVILRDGRDDLQIVVAQGGGIRYPVAVSLIHQESGTRIDLRGDDKDLRQRLTECAA